MTALLLCILGFFVAYAIYLATLVLRISQRPEDFLDGGRKIPPWASMFASTGVVLAGLNLHDYLRLLASYGLQFSHVAVGLVVVAVFMALVRKRLWLASRITGLRTLGDLLGDYFGSPTIRIYLLAVLFLFTVPLAAYCLTEAGELVQSATHGAVSFWFAIWSLGFFLFLVSVIGGWRAIVYVVAAQAFLVVSLFLFSAAFATTTFHDLAFNSGIAVPKGTLANEIPGVIQFSAGIGKSFTTGGIWTTTAILSFTVALIGLVLSPGFAFLGITTTARRAFAFEQVWLVSGLATGILILVGPVIAAEMVTGAPAGFVPAFAHFAARLAWFDPLVAVWFLAGLLLSLQIGTVFFAGSGANVATIELVARFILPDLTGAGQRLAARIVLAVIYAAIAVAASFAPFSSTIFASLALILSVQMLPAILGLCWIPWISRSAVLTGLIIGTILAVFTEPFGLIVFEGLFVDLPWGRWPLTIHSAGWGLLFNVAACLLVSLFTYAGEERMHRERLHHEFHIADRAQTSGPVVRTAKWSLILIWVFFALGPGAILGNSFFSQPIFTGSSVALGVPSLLIWQVLFWLLGVVLVWWLAYPSRMSIIDAEPGRCLVLRPAGNILEVPGRPLWITRLLGRLAGRQRTTT